jgi:molybdopterin converting factor small subunit
MFPKIIMAILFLVFVPQQRNQNQNQQDCRDIEGQLTNCRGKLTSCEQQLREADSRCEGRLRELRSQTEARYGQLRTELTAAQSELQTCQRDYSRLKGDLTKAQNDSTTSQRKSESLSNELNGSRRTVDDLRAQNAQQKSSYEAQLAERQAAIDAKIREIADKNTEISNKTRQIAQLNSTNVGLSAEMSKLNQSLKSAEQARIAADQAKGDLEKNLALLSDEQRKKPDVVLNLIKEYQIKMDQPGAPVSITQGKDGSLRRELVIGTLEVKPYPTEIPAEGKLQLMATFTPRPLPGGFASNTPWYVNLVYNPPPGINVAYSQEKSLGEEVREIQVGGEYKWVWIVDAPKDSQAVLATEMDIRAGFEKAKVERIAGQSVVLTREKPKPGWFASLFATVKENLTYILASIMTLLGIWAAYLNVRLRRVEVEKTEKVEAPGP